MFGGTIFGWRRKVKGSCRTGPAGSLLGGTWGLAAPEEIVMDEQRSSSCRLRGMNKLELG